ncbi:MAG: hypothetical protein FJZ95_00020 [Chloroflexi bacterium]|nr:hypothetical protein [Chloroflexota bacterium]
MTETKIGLFKKARASMCHHCPMCHYGRKHPESKIGRMLHHPSHAEHCAMWKAEKEVYGEGQSRD